MEHSKRQVGWQILDADGHNIHGEPDDPWDMPSYTILVGDAVETARRWAEGNLGYRVAPVYDGDIEEPEYVDELEDPEITPRL